jgi:methionyl-tRNA formyltransferase
LRLVFAGTPEFARAALAALHAAGHDIALVLTQPDRPAGRGMQLQASAVKQWAVQHGLPVAQPRSLKLDGVFAADAAQAREALARADAQAMVVAAYGLLLPHWVLDSFATQPRLGCVNIHASLLPRWRGAAPIHRAIEAGDSHTGISLMQMDAGLDTGAVLLRRALAISAQDTTASLHDRLAALGAELVVEGLAHPQDWQAQAQSTDGIVYAAKVDKAQAALDWRLDAALLALSSVSAELFSVHSVELFVGCRARQYQKRLVSGSHIRADLVQGFIIVLVVSNGYWLLCVGDP